MQTFIVIALSVALLAATLFGLHRFLTWGSATPKRDRAGFKFDPYVYRPPDGPQRWPWWKPFSIRIIGRAVWIYFPSGKARRISWEDGTNGPNRGGKRNHRGELFPGE